MSGRETRARAPVNYSEKAVGVDAVPAWAKAMQAGTTSHRHAADGKENERSTAAHSKEPAKEDAKKPAKDEAKEKRRKASVPSVAGCCEESNHSSAVMQPQRVSALFTACKLNTTLKHDPAGCWAVGAYARPQRWGDGVAY